MNLGESGNRSNDAIETARKEGETGVVVLLEQFEENSAETRHAVRVELGWYDEMAAEVFALVVFVSDGLLRIQPRRARNRISRFLKIAQGLPLELQMVQPAGWIAQGYRRPGKQRDGIQEPVKTPHPPPSLYDPSVT